MTGSDQRKGVLSTWRTSSRVTAFLIEHVPDKVWHAKIPGAPRRSIQMIAGHLHNCRCMWIQMVGKRHPLAVPRRVNRHRVSRRELIAALAQSSRAIGTLLEIGLADGGHLAGFSPPDVTHFLAYHVAHEAHHRGQIVMVARQLGHRLPDTVTFGLWQWGTRAREARNDI